MRCFRYLIWIFMVPMASAQVPDWGSVFPQNEVTKIYLNLPEDSLNLMLSDAYLAKKDYKNEGVKAETVAFIDDMATELAQADVVIARAGASTVTEVAAVGVAAIFVPFPQAVDDHQTANARFLSQEDAAMLVPQRELSAERLAELILSLDRASLMEMACKARDKGQRQATAHVVRACEELVS